ncbi:MAG: translation initiation factor IF-2 [Candidatus Methanofastidiosia archaeon]
MMSMIRQPIVAVLGHVDHGKTTLLDKIRGTKVASREAGGITQHIGATEIPIDIIEQICGDLLKEWKLTIPGLLFIDTPGHEAFTTLRARGSSLADIAILVIDINEGLQPQAVESLNILKQFKTPFIVVLNKIDRIGGWKSTSKSFLKTYSEQDEEVRSEIDNRTWEFIGKLYEAGFESDRFDNIKDFTKKISIIPASAKNGVGVPEIMMMIAGLSQKFLEKRLKIEISGPAKGTVLEVKETLGFGTTIDVIIYDGTLKKGDVIVLGGRNGIIQTRVRALLKPKPLDEIRDPRFKFDSVDNVSSAAGIKIAAPGLDEVLAGSPLMVAINDIDNVSEKIMREISKFRIKRDATGIIIKADTLGSLEAIVGVLKNMEVSIRNADVGEVQKKDVVEAISVAEINAIEAVIFAFNVAINEEALRMASESGIPIFKSDIIYKLIEEYEDFVETKTKEEEAKKKIGIVMAGKFQIMPKFVFRNAKPAIVGVEIVAGRVSPRLYVINEKGIKVGQIKSIKNGDEFLKEALVGQKVAMAIEGPVVGRQIREGEILYIDLSKSNIEKLKSMDLAPEEKEVVEFLSKLKKKSIL